MSEKEEVMIALSHFPRELDKNIDVYCTNTVLKKSRYIFTYKSGKEKKGYCTHCKNEFAVSAVKHNDKLDCPLCNSQCVIKASGLPRKNLYDEAYFVYYEKSIVNPAVIVARGFYVERDYSGDFRKVETKYTATAHYVFEIGNSKMLNRSYWSDRNFDFCSSVYSKYNSGHIAKIPCYCCYNSLENAIVGTPYQYSMYKEIKGRFGNDDYTEYFDLFSKYPLIESLVKMGFKEIVEDKLCNRLTYGAINWNGKSVFKMLRLNRNELSLIKENNIPVDCELLRYYQLARKRTPSITFNQVQEYVKLYGYHYNKIQKLLKYMTFQKLDSYVTKQFKMHKKVKRINYKTNILTTWYDYIVNCEKLMADLKSDSVLFPKDVYISHDKAVEKIKVSGNVLYDLKIQKRLESLKKYCFTYKGLFIRPAESTAELIKEGETLHHCVATNYTKPYVNGTTNILVIRKISEPDKPFYTAELKKDVFIQIHGNRNCSPTKAVNEFINQFELKVLKKENIKKSA